MNENNKIRTLGFYQPFGSLMLHGKIETRWVEVNKKPPFPEGKYLFYTTKKSCDSFELLQWCGREIMLSITETLRNEPTKIYSGYAIGMGDLVCVDELRDVDEEKAFVKFKGYKVVFNKYGREVTYIQWALRFENIERIKPFKWEFGKQGVGFVPESEIEKISIHQLV